MPDLDLEPKKPKPYKSADPMVWGVVVALISGGIVFFAHLMGEYSANTLLATPAKAAGAGFGFGCLIAMFRNWFNERPRAR